MARLGSVHTCPFCNDLKMRFCISQSHHTWVLMTSLRTFLKLQSSFIYFLFLKKFYFYFILLYNTVLVLPCIDMNPPRVYMSSQSWTPLPPPTPYHLSGSSPCTSPKHPVSCIEHRLVIHFLHDSTRFNAILPNHPTLSLSHRVQKSVLYICVSFAVLIQDYHYHLSKFNIYVLVYCIGVFLSGLLHSV